MDLPRYEIARIRTGQFIRDIDSDDGHVWGVDYNFALPGIMDAVRDLQQSGIKPDIRSDFDVYIDDGQLLYVKDSCNIKDGETPFFLHVFPADADDLPAGREDSGFDNLGFELIAEGGMHDGGCFASMDLPGYNIASIRTGQVVEGAETWRAYHNFDFPETLDTVQEIRRSGREPDIRSNFDVYIDDNQLLYAKSPCANEDGETPFFLHVFPADEDDLPVGREDSGFDNLDFELMQRGGMHDGDCFASVDLPGYNIASIRTGQVVEGAETWRAYHNFNFPEILDAVQEIRRSGREPDIRSNFDVYIDDGRLVYVKDSCAADDRDLPFFLHVFPADADDLPAGREESGFNTLGFELMQRGGMHDGDCFASVDLPEYKISRIRTGQWVHREGNVWEASIDFAK